MKKLLLILLCVPLMFSCGDNKNITETEFLKKLENNEVESVTFITNRDIAEVEMKNNSNPKPHYIFNIKDYQYLNQRIDEIVKSPEVDYIKINSKIINDNF